MDQQEEDSSLSVYKSLKFSTHLLMNGSALQPHGGWFEIRLFYVRVSPCAIHALPDHLSLRHLRREIGVSLEINGLRIPSSDTASITLRRDRVDQDSSEVTYVSTDSIRISGATEFEVHEDQELLLCGSLERVEASWINDRIGLEKGSKSGWSMECYGAASIFNGSSAFFQPKIGMSSPLIEVYVAGCCSSEPVILTKTIQLSPRRKVPRHKMLDAIPEDEEIEKEKRNGLIQSKLQLIESDVDEYEADATFGNSCYSEDMCTGEDGQLSWFNAGVRVGVGIGLGMCLGVGIGVGLLIRSYQATTRSFRRRFF